MNNYTNPNSDGRKINRIHRKRNNEEKTKKINQFIKNLKIKQRTKTNVHEREGEKERGREKEGGKEREEGRKREEGRGSKVEKYSYGQYNLIPGRTTGVN